MKKGIGSLGLRQPQPAHDLRLVPSPDGLEVVRIFRRPSRDPNFPRTDEEFKRMVLLTATITFDLARNGRKVTPQQIGWAGNMARGVVAKERQRQ